MRRNTSSGGLKSGAVKSRRHARTLFIITGAVILASIPVYFVFKLQEPDDTRSTPVIQGRHILKAQLANAGNATPEAAMESSLWAMAGGDYDAFIASLTPQMQDKMKAAFGDPKKFADETKKEMAKFKGFQILARKTLSDDRVELKFHIDILNTNGSPMNTGSDRTQLMVKLGDAWKIAGDTKSCRAGWDQGSEPEPVAPQ